MIIHLSHITHWTPQSSTLLGFGMLAGAGFGLPEAAPLQMVRRFAPLIDVALIAPGLRPPSGVV